MPCGRTDLVCGERKVIIGINCKAVVLVHSGPQLSLTAVKKERRANTAPIDHYEQFVGKLVVEAPGIDGLATRFDMVKSGGPQM